LGYFSLKSPEEKSNENDTKKVIFLKKELKKTRLDDSAHATSSNYPL